MSTSLTVQHRHLALPDACLFAPAALSIPSTISKSEFSRLGRALAQVGQSNDIWKADYALAAIEHFEKEEGLQLAHEATGLSEFFLYKASFVAKRFPPERRYQGYKYSAYRELMPFSPEWAYAFLARHTDEKLSSKSLRALAVSEFGSEPYKAKQPKKRAIRIRCEIYARLSEHAPSRKVASFIETLLEDYLKASEGTSRAVVPAPDATQPHPETSAATEPYQHVEVDLSDPTRLWTRPVGIGVADGSRSPTEYLDAEDGIHRLTNRPTYEQRRAQQIAEGAEPIKKKFKAVKIRELRLQWSPCVKRSSENGVVQRKANAQRADCFPTLEDAQIAEEKYYREKGYHNEIVYCAAPCGAYHVKHSYGGELQKKSAQPNL